MSDGLNVELNTAAWEAQLEELENGIENAVRPAAQAGAQILYQEVLAPVPAADTGQWFYGPTAKKAKPGEKKSKAYWFPAGTLRNSIFQNFRQELSGPEKAFYRVGWRWSNQKGGMPVAPYAYMLEYGTSRMSAKPFLRPAYDAAIGRAMNEVERVFWEGMQKHV